MKKMKVGFIVVLFAIMMVCLPENITAASAKTTVYKAMAKNFMQRKKNFTVSCPNRSVGQSIEKAINSGDDSEYYRVFFQVGQALDLASTTDDGDYLYGNIAEMGCEYRGGKLNFYDVTYLESKKQTAVVNKKLPGIIKAKKLNKGSDLDKIYNIYAYVIRQVRYDSRKKCNYSAYGGFVQRKTVCNGYALMIYKLSMACGIPCKFVSGYLKDGGKWYLHAWNMVKIEGKWYNLDATSDDGDDGEIYLDYFLRSDKTFNTDHKKDTFYKTASFKQKYKMATIDYAF